MRIDIKLYYLSRILYYIVCKNSIIFCDILLKKQKPVQNAVFTTNFKNLPIGKFFFSRRGRCPRRPEYTTFVGDGALMSLPEIEITMKNAP